MRLDSALVASILLFSCGAEPAAPGGGRAPNASTTSMVIGPEGGTVSLDRITVEIPSGALTATVAITIDAADRPAEGVGSWYELGPAGIVFEVPVTIRIGVDEGEIPSDASPSLTKLISHPAYEGGGREEGYLVLESSWDPVARVVSGVTTGFSWIGIRFIGCQQYVEPPIVSAASWEPCTRRTTFGWESASPVFIEHGYRQGYGQPVTWIWGWNTSLTSHRLELPAPVAPPGLGQSAYTFVYKIHAVQVCNGVTSLSGDVVAEIPAFEILPPDPPRDLTATLASGGEITISWRRPQAPESQEDGYQLSRSPGWSSMGLLDVGDVTSYQDREDVNPNTAYVYYLRAHHTSCGRTRYSSWLVGSTNGPVGAPEAIASVTAIARSSGSIEVSWPPAERAAEYVLRRSGGTASFSEVILQHPATSHLDTTAEPGSTYTYSVHGRNAAGAGAAASATAMTPEVTAGETTCGDLKLRVSPTSQTMRVQPNNCAPSCPPDALFEIQVERLNGVTSDVRLHAFSEAWQLSEYQLGTFGTRPGETGAILTGGVPLESSSLSVRVPAYAVTGEALPLTWRIQISAFYVDTPENACRAPVELRIEP